MDQVGRETRSSKRKRESEEFLDSPQPNHFSQKNKQNTQEDANKDLEAAQLKERKEGNKFFLEFFKSKKEDENPANARDNLLTAMIHYKSALEISQKNNIHDGAMSASKNIAVTAGYIAEIEPLINNRLARYKESVKYFSKSLYFCRQAKAEDELQWRIKIIPGLNKVVDSFFEFVEESEIGDDMKNKVCEGFVKEFDDWSEDWIELSVMADVRVKQGEMLNNMAVVNISDKNFKAGMSDIAEVWRPLELAKKYARSLSFVANSGKIISEVLLLKKIFSTKTLKGVNDAMKKAMKMMDKVTEDEKLKEITKEVETLKGRSHWSAIEGVVKELKRMEHVVKAGDKITQELNDVWKECSIHKAVGEGLQMASQGEEMLKMAVAGDENLRMEMVWDAMDLFRQAIILSAGEEIELETMARGKIGLIYLKVLDNKPQARDYLTEAMDTAKVMMIERSINLYDFSWYGEVADGFNQLQGEKIRREDEEWIKEKAPLLEDPFVKLALKSLEDHKEDTDEEFAKFLFGFLPPKHRDDCQSLKESLDTGFKENRMKMLQKMVTFWHPDRVRKEEDKKHFIICEEVTKCLTYRYNLFTCGAGA